MTLFEQISRVQGVVTMNDAAEILGNITKIGDNEDKQFLSFIEDLHRKNFDVEELANCIYEVLMGQQIADKVRIAAAAEYQKFG